MLHTTNRFHVIAAEEIAIGSNGLFIFGSGGRLILGQKQLTRTFIYKSTLAHGGSGMNAAPA